MGNYGSGIYSSDIYSGTTEILAEALTGTQAQISTIGIAVIVIGIIVALIVGSIRDIKKGKKGNVKLSISFFMLLLITPDVSAQSVFSNPAFDVILILIFMAAAFIIIRNMLKSK